MPALKNKAVALVALAVASVTSVVLASAASADTTARPTGGGVAVTEADTHAASIKTMKPEAVPLGGVVAKTMPPDVAPLGVDEWPAPHDPRPQR